MSVFLDNRALLSVSGAEAETFLQNLVTTNLASLVPGEARAGALLSPQGKILFDFLVSRGNESELRLDTRADIAADLARRLMLYRLRAKVDIAAPRPLIAEVAWDGEALSSAPTEGGALRDSRFPATWDVVRRYHATASHQGSPIAAWDALRISGGVAESGRDYALGDAFPHDVLLDQNGGVSFRKGCFVGQEVVSRMQHRGTARRRVLILSAVGPLPPTGTEVAAGGRPVGALGTVAGPSALAVLRIDRVAEARAAGVPVTAAGVELAVALPPGVGFGFPVPEAGGAEPA